MTLRDIGQFLAEAPAHLRAFAEEIVHLAVFQSSWLDAPLASVFWTLVLYFILAKAFYSYVWLSLKYLVRYKTNSAFRAAEREKGDDAPLTILRSDLKGVSIGYAKLIAFCAVFVVLSYFFLP
jgi:hypothetical protein